MIRYFAILPVIFLLAGCASSHVVLHERPERAELADFSVNGRVSINYRGERHSAGLHWKHRSETDEILLLAPLGQTAARVYRDARSATLEADGELHQADDVESLMQRVLGWHLPLDGLHHWVLGMSDPGSSSLFERDGEGRIEVLYQGGWEVRYLGYQDTLPSRLQLSREGLQVKLLIDEWDWNPQ